jgi:teichuronic acid biosynthesis glycosyltransferase TuaC
MLRKSRVSASERPRVLVLSRNYPNNLLPTLGIWAQRQTHALARLCELTVVAPSPYFPPLPGPEKLTRFRRVARERSEETVQVHHPRFLAGPGHLGLALEALTQYRAAVRVIERSRLGGRFDLIHAHFSYADGVAAALLARRYRVPFIITEHTLLRPWLDEFPVVRRQVRWALGRANAVIGVSRAVCQTIDAVLLRAMAAQRIPVGVDGSQFPLKSARTWGPEERLLFVGWLRHVKGVDTLLHAMALVRQRRAAATLTVVGSGFFGRGERTEDAVHHLAADCGLQDCVRFIPYQPPAEVARFMRESDVLILPSRRESCGSVLIEALASGTPVVGTRCGGPEDIVTPEVGALAAVDDPVALAHAIEGVLERREQYDPGRLRDYALGSFSWDVLARQYLQIYARATALPFSVPC